MIFRAIIAPSNKDGADDLARGLTDLGWEVYATGGTHRFLTGVGVAAQHIEDLTGFPEILDGRVKDPPSPCSRRHLGATRRSLPRGTDGGARHRHDRPRCR